MGLLLLILLLFTLLLGSVAASPSMDPALPAGPSGSFYPDPDGILDTFCNLCAIPIQYCGHGLVNVPTRQPSFPFTPATFLNHPEWPGNTFISRSPSPEQEPIQYTEPRRISTATVRELDNNATRMQPSTIHLWNELAYTPGDRLARPVSIAHTSQRRTAPRQNGFPCDHDGCAKTFNRQCDLTRHQKTHLRKFERPHKCALCPQAFLYPKDRDRHQRTHNKSDPSQQVLYCPHRDCNNTDGFSRKDNLRRHMRKLHPGVPITV